MRRKLQRCRNILERIEKKMVPFTLYLGGILISCCGFFLFSELQVTNIIGLKIGVCGLMLVMTSSILDNIISIGKNKIDNRLKTFDNKLDSSNNVENTKSYETGYEKKYSFENRCKVSSQLDSKKVRVRKKEK